MGRVLDSYRVRLAGRLIAAMAWQAPRHVAGLRLTELPAGSLFGAMVPSAQRRMHDITTHVSLGWSRFPIRNSGLPLTVRSECHRFLTAF